jgi:O-antigen/teichoic acid export membrane protein
LSGIKQLANQTLWYGLSNIVGRFINYLLTPILAYFYAAVAFGDISILFALAAFLNIIFTYGMETSYFRFNKDTEEKKVFNTALSSLLLSTTLFTIVLLMMAQPLANLMEVGNHSEFVTYVIAIVALDTLAVLPFSKLRFEGRPRKFALIKLSNILINFILVVVFIGICKPAYESGSTGLFANMYNPKIGIGYVFLAQVIASACTLFFLWKELSSFRPDFNKKLFLEILAYSTPLIIVGFGGMINETIDRFMIINRFHGTVNAAKAANGIYSANNKLAILIVIFIQTFKMGAEPFFFKHSDNADSKKTYSRIMNLFVIASCLFFLSVVLFLDIWKHFMSVKKHPEYAEGLYIVPMLMMSKLFLGIYYNLSIWYKLTNKNTMGAFITILGALITIVLNYTLIPIIGYFGCAIANFTCYGTMMLISYFQGRKHYPVPYDWKRSLEYILLSTGLYAIHYFIRNAHPGMIIVHGAGILLSLLFIAVVFLREKKELIKIPYLQKLYTS